MGMGESPAGKGPAGDENFFRRPCMGTGKKPGGEGVTGGHPPKGAPSGRWKTVFQGPKSGCPRLGPLPREGGLSAVLWEIFCVWEILPPKRPAAGAPGDRKKILIPTRGLTRSVSVL